MKKSIIAGLILLILFGFIYYVTRFFNSIDKIHYHAGFVVYVDGQKIDFSGAQYMKVEPCYVNGVEHTFDNQLEKAHLHDGVGDVVHVHRPHALWNDLFTNIQYRFQEGKTVIGLRNGKVIPDILQTSIMPYESIVILVGKSIDVSDESYVTIEHIKQVEAAKESCGS